MTKRLLVLLATIVLLVVFFGVAAFYFTESPSCNSHAMHAGDHCAGDSNVGGNSHRAYSAGVYYPAGDPNTPRHAHTVWDEKRSNYISAGVFGGIGCLVLAVPVMSAVQAAQRMRRK